MFDDEENEDEVNVPNEEAIRYATMVVNSLKATGRDYSVVLTQIALFFENYLWRGNYDGVLNFEDSTVKSLHFIQEDEYDQHIDDDEKPTYHAFTADHYIIVRK